MNHIISALQRKSRSSRSPHSVAKEMILSQDKRKTKTWMDLVAWVKRENRQILLLYDQNPHKISGTIMQTQAQTSKTVFFDEQASNFVDCLCTFCLVNKVDLIFCTYIVIWQF